MKGNFLLRFFIAIIVAIAIAKWCGVTWNDVQTFVKNFGEMTASFFAQIKGIAKQ